MAEVITRLNEAASVLRRLPEGGRYERPFLTSWPDYKPDPNTAYGDEDVKVTKHNEAAKPFTWTAAAQDIIKKVDRARNTLNQVKAGTS